VINNNNLNMDPSAGLEEQINTKRSTRLGHGFELNRLVSPNADEFSMDFCCCLCKSKPFLSHALEIVNTPVECTRSSCSSLACHGCVEDFHPERCVTCLNPQPWTRKPSPVVLKMLSKFKMSCGSCLRIFDLEMLKVHEQTCSQSVCANELCLSKDAKIKFVFEANEYFACSKKCQKVTKFGLVLRKNDD